MKCADSPGVDYRPVIAEGFLNGALSATGADVPPGTVPLPMLDLEPPVALEVGAS